MSCECRTDRRNAEFWLEKLKTVLGRHRCRLEKNAEMHLKQIECECIDRIHVAQNTLTMSSCERDNESLGSKEGEEWHDLRSFILFSPKTLLHRVIKSLTFYASQ
jgi:hypothetical protein